MLSEFKTTVSEGNEANGGLLEKVGNAVTGVKNAVMGTDTKTKTSPKETPAPMPSKFTVDISPASIAALKKGNALGGGTGT